MIQIKTEYNTYTAKMSAKQSEKLFRKIVMDLIVRNELEAHNTDGPDILPEHNDPQDDIQEAEQEEAEEPDVQEEEPEASVDEAAKTDEEYDPVMDPEPIGRKYKGFLLIKCQHCGKVRPFCAKAPVSEFKCDSCGEKTELGELSYLNVDCECGKHSYYKTNMKDFLFDVDCIVCGSPVTVKWNSKKKLYETVV